MAQQDPSGATPPNVAELATQEAVISTTSPQVIGIFGPQAALRAMIRWPNGRVRTVERGARVRGKTIVGIDAAGVILSGGGRQERLTLP